MEKVTMMGIKINKVDQRGHRSMEVAQKIKAK